MKKVRVEASRPYDVLIGYGLLSSLGEEIARWHKPCKVALVADETVFSLYGTPAVQSLARAGFKVFACPVPPGEGSKSMEVLHMLWQRFAENALTRSDIVVALGGGVTGDVAGFAAACYLRGVEYVQVPTTLLAAVDSSVGGKTAINLPQGKNLVGMFWQPSLVVCDCDTFATLPREVFLDGVAESLKCGVLCDRNLFEQITQGGLEGDCLDIVARCVQIKAKLVAEDEHDTGARQLLNFGHTLGHAIEKVSGFSIAHGHAVAIGMVAAARMAEGLGLCVMGTAGILMAMMDRLGLPSEILYGTDELIEAALKDKKRQGGELTLVLPESIGHCVLHTAPVKDLPRLVRLAKGERI